MHADSLRLDQVLRAASRFRDSCSEGQRSDLGVLRSVSHGLSEDRGCNERLQCIPRRERRQTQNGLYPICVQGGGSGSGTRYAAIFATRNQPQPRLWTVTGSSVAALAEFDTRMKQVMQDKGVRAASLTLGKNGKIMLSRGLHVGRTPLLRDYPARRPLSPGECQQGFHERREL
jgi:hypothetical protein